MNPLIAEARRIVTEKWVVTLAGRSGETVMELADALEAAEAQVARCQAFIAGKIPDYPELASAISWPADLLEAVRLLMFLPNGQERHGGRIEGGCEWDTGGKCDCYIGKARMTFRRHGLLKEAR